MDLGFIAGAGVKECCRATLATFKYWNDAVVGGNAVMSLPAGAMVSRRRLSRYGLGLPAATFIDAFAKHFPTVNAIYAPYFPEDPPARIFVCVPEWTGPFDIEINCVAVV